VRLAHFLLSSVRLVVNEHALALHFFRLRVDLLRHQEGWLVLGRQRLLARQVSCVSRRVPSEGRRDMLARRKGLHLALLLLLHLCLQGLLVHLQLLNLLFGQSVAI